MASFVKMLTESDANHNLTVPCSILPHINGGDGGEFRAMDDHTGIIYEFFLSTNNNISSASSSSNGKRQQFYKKPVLQSQGWLEFVKDKGLQVGDTIYFWKDEDGLFRIEALLLNSMSKDSNPKALLLNSMPKDSNPEALLLNSMSKDSNEFVD